MFLYKKLVCEFSPKAKKQEREFTLQGEAKTDSELKKLRDVFWKHLSLMPFLHFYMIHFTIETGWPHVFRVPLQCVLSVFLIIELVAIQF